MITGNEAAMPCTDTLGSDGMRYDPLNTGLTIRQHFAAMAMQGMCANLGINATGQGYEVHLANCSVIIADALINALNQPLK